MCDRPEAGELETVWQEYLQTDEVYIVGACTNFSIIDSLYDFTQVQGVSYPLSSSEQLGAYFSDYAETFNFIGGNMTLITQLTDIVQAPLISFWVEQSIGSLQGITLMNPVESQFMQQNLIYFNLNEVFLSVNGINPVYSISSNSNENAVNTEIIEDSILVVTRGNIQGMADISISAEPAAVRIDNNFSIFNNGDTYDDFETGDFSFNDWQFSGYANWIIEDSISYTGTFSARSGTIDHSQESRLDLTIDVAEDGVVSFAYKVSSENQWDILYFKIDGAWMTYGWSGDTGWNTVSFDITAGEHLLTWGYHKDSTGTALLDCAWIDSILLPGEYNPGIGDNDIISFTIPEQIGETEINIYNHTVNVEVPSGTNLSALIPTIEISDLSTIYPESGIPQDFTNPVEYVVTADNGNEQTWTVFVSTPVNTNGELLTASIKLYNYPNPFNPTTTITFSLTAKNAKNAKLVIYNLKGQKVKTFSITPRPSTTLRMTQAGSNQNSVVWNGDDDSGNPVSSGIYFYKLKSGNFEQTKKMILMK